MAAEFYIFFDDPNWYVSHKNKIEQMITQLETFILKKNEHEFWLKGLEGQKENINDFDARFFTEKDNYIFMEVSIHPKSIEETITILLNWIRMNTNISVEDEDGEQSSW